MQVALSFIHESRNYPEHDFHIILGKKISRFVDESLFPENYFFYKLNYRPAERLLRFSNPAKDLIKLEKRINPDVVFTTSGPSYWRPKAPHLLGFNLGHYVYQDSPFFQVINLSDRIVWKIKEYMHKFFLRRDADAYIVQTDDVNKRLRRWIKNENVYTVTNTASHFYSQVNNHDKKLPLKNENEFRFLIFTSYYRHKNLEILHALIRELDENIKHRIKFILTLQDIEFNRLFPENSKSRHNIINIGPIPASEGPSLYKECDALFLPSLIECFSANYPEAMMMGKPIVASDLSFSRDICREAALYYSPLDAKDAARKICRMVESEKIRNHLIEEGYKRINEFDNAQVRAKKIINLCEKLLLKSINKVHF